MMESISRRQNSFKLVPVKDQKPVGRMERTRVVTEKGQGREIKVALPNDTS